MSGLGATLLKIAAKFSLDVYFSSDARTRKLDLRELRRLRAKILVTAKAELEADQIRSGHKDLSDLPLAIEFSDTAQLPRKHRTEPVVTLSPLAIGITRSVIVDRVREDVNVAGAILHAEEELKEHPVPNSDKELDEDWLHAWRKGASEVASEKMQQLWGALLAAEVLRPGTQSRRTIEFLKSISGAEAQEIADLLRFAIDGTMVYSTPALDEHHWNYGRLLEMVGIGILSDCSGEVAAPITSRSTERFFTELRWHGGGLRITGSDPNHRFTMRVYSLTRIGRDLASLRRLKAPPDAYVKEVKALCSGQGLDVEQFVTLYPKD